jgi:hypothetical protein
LGRHGFLVDAEDAAAGQGALSTGFSLSLQIVDTFASTESNPLR